MERTRPACWLRRPAGAAAAKAAHHGGATQQLPLRRLLGVKILLETRERLPDFLRLAEVGDGVLNRTVFQAE